MFKTNGRTKTNRPRSRDFIVNGFWEIERINLLAPVKWKLIRGLAVLMDGPDRYLDTVDCLWDDNELVKIRTVALTRNPNTGRTPVRVRLIFAVRRNDFGTRRERF